MSAESVAPVPFIVGVPRSGTTMLRLMLDAHPDLAIPPETYFVTNLIEAGYGGAGPEQLANVLVSHRRWGDLGIEEAELRRRLNEIGRPSGGDAARVAFELYAHGRGKPRWGDKTPAYLTNIAEIHEALPEARFIHLIRDGRDVALSILRMPEADRPMRRPDSVGLVARRWSRRIKRARAQADGLPHYLELRYEDLVRDPGPALRQACDLIELPFTESMLDFHAGASERLAEIDRDLAARDDLPAQSAEGRTAPHALASQPPSEGRIGVWREEMTAEQLAEFEDKGGEMLRSLGYDGGGG